MGNILIIIGILISLLSFAAIFFSKKKKKTIRRSGTGEVQNIAQYSLNDLDVEYKGLKKEIVELIKDFNRTATYNTNMIDEKISYLSEMREDMDRRIVKLTKLMTDVEILHNRLEKTEVRLDSKFRDVENNLETLTDAIHTESRNYRERDTRYSENNRHYREYEPKDDSLGKEFEEKIIRMVPKNNNRLSNTEEQIFEYYDKGMSLKEISELTGKGIGEIEFIMGLRRKR